MELCNLDLFTFIKENSFFERIKIADIFLKDILNGLYELHSNYNSISRIHHDLKLENILVNKNNKINNTRSKFTFKLCDFGSSNRLHEQIKNHISTLVYTPPEIYMNYNYDDETTNLITSHPSMDFFSLGIILYNLITSYQYFSLDDIYNIKEAINLEEYWNRVRDRNKNLIITTFEKEIENNAINYEYFKYNRIIEGLLDINPRLRVIFLKKNRYKVNDFKLSIWDKSKNINVYEDLSNINWYYEKLSQLKS